MKLGIMQGRLLPPVDGHIQEFPHNWKDEMVLVNELGLVGVEWLVTKKSYPNNPILKGNTFSEYPIISVCLDNLVDEQIDNPDFVKDIISSCYSSGVRRFTIPLLEESSMINDNRRKQFCGYIKDSLALFDDAIFSFEAELDIDKLDEIVYLSDNFKVTYDTGNTTSFGLNHVEYINHYGNKINNVHLKDRTFDANTVEPLKGDTDFIKIFESLKYIGYDGNYIVQTARGEYGQEVKTISHHMKIFKELYNV
jgi:L-ribulose-5-phosphate 3-epimerase